MHTRIMPVGGDFRRQEEDGTDGKRLQVVTSEKNSKKHPKNGVFRVSEKVAERANHFRFSRSCIFFRASSLICSFTSGVAAVPRSEEHTSELQSRENLVCRLLLEKKKIDKLSI